MLLIIDENQKRRDTVREAFYIMGVLAVSLPPKGMMGEIGGGYRAILLYLSDLTDAAILDKTRRAFAGAEIFTLYPKERLAGGRTDNYTLRDDMLAPEILIHVTRICGENGKLPPQTYMLMGLDACSATEARYMGRAVRMTKTELMILRYLLAAYPTPRGVSEILKHAYRSGRMPEAGAVRTEISIINRKLYGIADRKIIKRTEDGYVISAPTE